MKTQMLGPAPGVSSLLGLGEERVGAHHLHLKHHLHLSIPGDADATGPGTTLRTKVYIKK